jgi:hypothetical protein
MAVVLAAVLRGCLLENEALLQGVELVAQGEPMTEKRPMTRKVLPVMIRVYPEGVPEQIGRAIEILIKADMHYTAGWIEAFVREIREKKVKRGK